MQSKAAFISEKGGNRTVRGKDLLDKISLADDKYIEEASVYKKKNNGKVFKFAVIAAVAALAVLLPVILITAANKANHGIPTPPDVTETVHVPVTDKDTTEDVPNGNEPVTETVADETTEEQKTPEGDTVEMIDTVGQTDPIEIDTETDEDPQTGTVEDTTPNYDTAEIITVDTDENLETDETTVNASNPSIYPLEFDSFSDLKTAVSQNGKYIINEFSEQGATRKQLENIAAFVEKLNSKNNAVPYYNGKPIELRNKEGYANITLYASEAYGLPCIFCHPSVSTGENYYIKITYLPDETANQNDKTTSEIIRKLSPNTPNVNNLGNQHKSIYEQTVTLADREVTALVYEYKNDSRNSTIFVYDDLLVEVKGSPDVWSSLWLSNLSFGSFQ